MAYSSIVRLDYTDPENPVPFRLATHVDGDVHTVVRVTDAASIAAEAAALAEALS